MLTRPAILLRMEEALLLATAVLLYAHLHFSWMLFAGLFFAPDLLMAGYLANPRVGAALYNLGHTLSVPLALLFLSIWLGSRPRLVGISLVWIAHIAFDRLLGYGLKYREHFKDTHLQRVS